MSVCVRMDWHTLICVFDDLKWNTERVCRTDFISNKVLWRHFLSPHYFVIQPVPHG
jgi:hypothetical protein